MPAALDDNNLLLHDPSELHSKTQSPDGPGRTASNFQFL